MDAIDVSWPDDIISLILSKLPAQHIVRFKRLSRHWLQTIIGSHLFHHQMVQALRANPPQSLPSLLLSEDFEDYALGDFYNYVNLVPTSRDMEEEPVTSIPLIPFETGSPSYVGLCHGLICFAIWADNSNCSGLVIWNPKKDESLPIVAPPLPPTYSNPKANCVFGWGFSDVDKIFKLFVICCDRHSQSEILVCEVGHDMWWRELQTNPPNDMLIMDKNNITAHGCLTWLFQRDAFTHSGFHTTSLLCLNTSSEECEVVELPDSISFSQHYDLRVGELRGSISILHKDGDFAEIWVIENHLFETWNMMYRFQPPYNVGSWFGFVKPIVAEGKDVLVLKYWQTLIQYCPEDDTPPWERHFDFLFGEAHSFAATLISPTILGGGGGDIENEGAPAGEEAAGPVVPGMQQ